MTRFLITVAGYHSQGDRGVALSEAAERVAMAYQMGLTVKAQVVATGMVRDLTKKENEALATAAALIIREEQS
jgi:hypothetical protein